MNREWRIQGWLKSFVRIKPLLSESQKHTCILYLYRTACSNKALFTPKHSYHRLQWIIVTCRHLKVSNGKYVVIPVLEFSVRRTVKVWKFLKALKCKPLVNCPFVVPLIDNISPNHGFSCWCMVKVSCPVAASMVTFTCVSWLWLADQVYTNVWYERM